MVRNYFLSLTLLVVAFPVLTAQAQDAPYVDARPMPRTVAFKLYKQQLIKIRTEALAQETAEGGALSAASKARFQRRIDHVERVYRVRLRDGFFAA